MTRLLLYCPDPGYGYCAAREGGRVDRNRARCGEVRGRGCADGRLATTVVAAVVKLSAPVGAPALPVGFIAGAAESGAVAGRSSSSSQVSFQIDIVDIDTGEAEDMLKQEFEHAGATAPTVIEADVSQDEDTERLMTQISERDNAVDIFISNNFHMVDINLSGRPVNPTVHSYHGFN